MIWLAVAAAYTVSMGVLLAAWILKLNRQREQRDRQK